jgi:hypothetical protein
MFNIFERTISFTCQTAVTGEDTHSTAESSKSKKVLHATKVWTDESLIETYIKYGYTDKFE